MARSSCAWRCSHAGLVGSTVPTARASAPMLGDRVVLFAFVLVGLHLLIAATFQPLGATTRNRIARSVGTAAARRWHAGQHVVCRSGAQAPSRLALLLSAALFARDTRSHGHRATEQLDLAQASISILRALALRARVRSLAHVWRGDDKWRAPCGFSGAVSRVYGVDSESDARGWFHACRARHDALACIALRLVLVGAVAAQFDLTYYMSAPRLFGRHHQPVEPGVSAGMADGG